MRTRFFLYSTAIAILTVFLWFGNGQVNRSAWGMSEAAPKCLKAIQCKSDHKVPICHNTGSSSNPVVFICVDDSAANAHKTNHGDKEDVNLTCCGGNDSDQGKKAQDKQAQDKQAQEKMGKDGRWKMSLDDMKKFHAKFNELTEDHSPYAAKKTWELATEILGGEELTKHFYVKMEAMGYKNDETFYSFPAGMVGIMAAANELGIEMKDGTMIEKVQKLYSVKMFGNGVTYDVIKKAMVELGAETAKKFEGKIEEIEEGMYGKKDMISDNSIMPLAIALPAMVGAAGDGEGAAGTTENQNTVDIYNCADGSWGYGHCGGTRCGGGACKDTKAPPAK